MVKIKKAIFINPYPYYAEGINEATMYPPLGIAYLASVVESMGVKAKIIDANVLQLQNDTVFKQIKKFNPDLVAISVNIVTCRSGIELAKEVKKKLKKLVILGGPHATAAPENVLVKSKADCIVRQEGEVTIKEIIEKNGKFTDIDGITYMKKGKIITNKDRALITDLDTIPFPAYHLLPELKKYKSKARKFPIGSIISSRGCPYACIYCNKSIFGFKFRSRSPKNFVDEVELLVNKYGAKQIDILDDNFTLNIENAEKILDLIIEKKMGIAINLQNGVRADRLTRKLVKKMKQAGVVRAGIGIESGSPRMLKIMKKTLNLSKVIKAIEWFREEDIVVTGFFMIGLPGETEASMRKTIDFAKKANPHIANFSIVVPLPGTELYEMIDKKGGFTKNIDSGLETGFLSSNFYYRFDNLAPETILKYQRMAYSEFYFRPSKAIEMITTIRSSNELKWTMNSAANMLGDVFVKSFINRFSSRKPSDA